MLKIFQGLCATFVIQERFNLPEAITVPVSSVSLDCGSQLEGYDPKMGNFFLLVTPSYFCCGLFAHESHHLPEVKHGGRMDVTLIASYSTGQVYQVCKIIK